MIHPERGTTYNPLWAGMLEKALPNLWNGTGVRDRPHTICSSLGDIEGPVNDLIEEISDRLYKAAECVYFSTFLRKQLAGNSRTPKEWVPDAAVEIFNSQELQAARKAWMLDMIEEFRGE